MDDNYDFKIKLCKILGAKQFQKFVFKIEKIKYKIINLVFPNIIKFYSKSCDKNCKKYIKHNPDCNQEEIKHISLIKKINFNGEINNKKNCNYHFKTNNPLEFQHWLDYNKNIHKKGLIKDAILLSCLIGTSIVFPHNLIIELSFLITLLSTFVNFECVNLQNYNIYRLKKNEEKLKEVTEKRMKQDIKKYGNVSKTIVNLLDQKGDILKPQELVDNIDSKEQLEELRNLLIAMHKYQNVKIEQNLEGKSR